MILVGGENLMDMIQIDNQNENALLEAVPCLLYTSPSPRDLGKSRMPSSA